MGWEIGIDTYTLCMKQTIKENLQHRELYSVLCGDLNGKKIQKRGYICVCVCVCVCVCIHLYVYIGFPGGASGKEPICQCRRHKRREFDPWVGKIPWHGNPLQHSRLENPWTEEPGGLESMGCQRGGHD